MRLWGFHSDTFEPRLPDPKAVEALVKAGPAMADLHIDGVKLSCANPAVRLDLGGYAKGYALDLAAATLRREGVRNALINIGGNVMALGSKEGTQWRVGIQHPRQSGPMATIALEDGEAIGTSGDYQRFFEVEGQRYAHLLDPRTGYPADQTEAVTVLIPPGPKAGTLSDATSKPICVAGDKGWREMARKMESSLVFRVDRSNQVFVTEALHKRLEFIGQPPPLTILP